MPCSSSPAPQPDGLTPVLDTAKLGDVDWDAFGAAVAKTLIDLRLSDPEAFHALMGEIVEPADAEHPSRSLRQALAPHARRIRGHYDPARRGRRSVPHTTTRRARARGAGQPRAQAARSSARSGDSGDDSPGEPEAARSPSSSSRTAPRRPGTRFSPPAAGFLRRSA